MRYADVWRAMPPRLPETLLPTHILEIKQSEVAWCFKGPKRAAKNYRVPKKNAIQL